MKVVIAIDSFKGSMTSLEAGNAAKKGILQIQPDADVVIKPLADGGEGTVDALVDGMRGNRIDITVSDPLGRPTKCTYGILPDGTAVMEMAQTAGITKLSANERNPLVTSTYGVGEMIADAIAKGCRRFVIGIGGSATNDGGMGMLSALGYTFLDKKGEVVKQGAQALSQINEIRTEQVISELAECEFKIACDVDNPLCGVNGATYIYGPQKGLPKDLCQDIDEDMLHYAKVVESYCFDSKSKERQFGKVEKELDKVSYVDYPGAGAAGGLGFAFLTLLQGELVSGIDLILDTIGLDKELEQADIVITGEGCLDYQTAMGKAPVGVTGRAKRYGCKVLAFAGCIGDGAEACKEKGIDAFYSIAEEVVPLEELMKTENARRNMEKKVKQVFLQMITGEKEDGIRQIHNNTK